jgi:hypothetical protein
MVDFIETGKINITNTHICYYSLFWYVMGTSIKKRMEDIEPVAITTKAVNLMEVRFLLSCVKHMFERIISIRGEIWTQ